MCDERERLIEYLYDEGAPADRHRVEAHVDECADCREELRAFRRVRQDLLAWEVPETGSVWTPFSPTPQVAWYQQVPAWAMTAAAGVMLLLGAFGGGVAAQLMRPASADPALAASEPAPVASREPEQVAALVQDDAFVPRPAGLSDEEILALVRREMARVPVSTAPRGLTPADAKSLVAEAAQVHWTRVYDYLTQVAAERDLERKHQGEAMTLLTSQIADLERQVNYLISEQQKRGQQ